MLVVHAVVSGGVMQALEGSCFATHLSGGSASTHGTLRCRPLIGRHNGARFISLRTLEFAPGRSPRIQTHDCDDVWYVLDGCADLYIDGIRYPVGPDTGIYIAPGRSAWVDNTADQTLRVVSVRCPDPGIDAAIHPAPPECPAPSSSARAPLVHLMDCEAETTADRWYRVLVDPRLGCEQVTQFVGSIPTGRAPDHFHEYEEVLCILEGHGRMWAGATSSDIAPGSCVYLPRRQMHCVENLGASALRLLGVFYPAGSPADARKQD